MRTLVFSKICMSLQRKSRPEEERGKVYPIPHISSTTFICVILDQRSESVSRILIEESELF